MRIILILIILYLPILSRAQNGDTIVISKNNNNLIDGSFIKDYKNKWKVTSISNDGKESAYREWTDYGNIVELNGKMYLHRVQDIYDPEWNLMSTWVNFAELPGLNPTKFYITNLLTQRMSYIQFHDDKIINVTNLTTNDGSFAKDTILIDRQVYDAKLYGMLLVSLPFELGKTFAIPHLNIETNKQDILYATVIGPERIKNLKGKEINAFKIITHDGFTFWLNKKAPYVYQLAMDHPHGKIIWRSY